MTVDELIKELLNFPGEMEVLTYDGNDGQTGEPEYTEPGPDVAEFHRTSSGSYTDAGTLYYPAPSYEPKRLETHLEAVRLR